MGMLEDLDARLKALESMLPTTAKVGQFLKVTAVDENGKITALAAENNKSCTCDPLNYASAEEFNKAWRILTAITNTTIPGIQDQIGTLPTGYEDMVDYVDKKTAQAGGSEATTIYKLPFTASEFMEKLSYIREE